MESQPKWANLAALKVQGNLITITLPTSYGLDTFELHYQKLEEVPNGKWYDPETLTVVRSGVPNISLLESHTISPPQGICQQNDSTWAILVQPWDGSPTVPGGLTAILLYQNPKFLPQTTRLLDVMREDQNAREFMNCKDTIKACRCKLDSLAALNQAYEILESMSDSTLTIEAYRQLQILAAGQPALQLDSIVTPQSRRLEVLVDVGIYTRVQATFEKKQTEDWRLIFWQSGDRKGFDPVSKLNAEVK